MALTSEPAAPMPEAIQRTTPAMPASLVVNSAERPAKTKTENLEPLAFKVPPAFRKRFKKRALEAELKLNELLFEAFAAWEEKAGFKK
jgi:hypothetical protein